MANLIFTILVSFIICASAVVQRVTIYSGPNQTGQSVTFTAKIPDLVSWKAFLSTAQSYCANGWYDFYPGTNYQGKSVTFGGQGSDGEETKCGNGTFAGFNSARSTGPLDIHTPAVTFLEGNPDFVFGGREVVVEGSGLRSIPLREVKVVYSHGRSNWTLYAEQNFAGPSWCFQENGKYIKFQILNGTVSVRSVRRGCDEGKEQSSGHFHGHNCGRHRH